MPTTPDEPGVVYILHFNATIAAHAHHYCGSTSNLRQRLQTHATGHGSRLTRHLRELGVTWSLAACGLCPRTTAKYHERQLKDQSNTPRYCAYCQPHPPRIPGCRMYDLDELAERMPIHSWQMTGTEPLPGPITVRQTSEREPPATMRMIQHLMRRDKDALGFIPAGGESGLQITHDAGKILIVANNGQDVGYMATTIRPPTRNHPQHRVTIAQTVVTDEARLMGHGRALQEHLATIHPIDTLILATVASDLAANDYWRACGYQPIKQAKHMTSGRPLTTYAKETR